MKKVSSVKVGTFSTCYIFSTKNSSQPIIGAQYLSNDEWIIYQMGVLTVPKGVFVRISRPYM